MSCGFHQNKIVKKSRKAHVCEHCNLEIPVGISYNIASGIFDGDFYHIKEHLECSRAYIELNKNECNFFPLYDSDNFIEHIEMIKDIYNIKG